MGKAGAYNRPRLNVRTITSVDSSSTALRVAIRLPERLHRRASWAIESLLATRRLRWTIDPIGEDAGAPDIGVGIDGTAITIPVDERQWEWRSTPPDATRDPLAATFWWLSRVEERLAREHGAPDAFDAHGRFRAAASALPAELTAAPVDDIARDLFAGLGHTAHWPDGAPYALALTHDIDTLQQWNRRGVRRAGSTAISAARERRAGDFVRAAASLGTAPTWRVLGADPWQNAGSIARLERRYGAVSTSYVLAGHHAPEDGAAASYVARVGHYVAEVQRTGGEVGVHGSYTTSDHPGRLAHERELVGKLAGSAARSHRHHYLRYLPDRDWPQIAAAGFQSDASLGYAERPGWRSGFSHPYRAWSHEHELPLDLIVIPLAFMDATLERRYLNVPAGSAEARSIVDSMQLHLGASGGAASVLWHNDKLGGIDSRPYVGLYEHALQRAVDDGAWLTTAGALADHWIGQLEWATGSTPVEP